MAHITQFPQVIYVTVEEDGDNDWLSAQISKEGSLGDSKCAIVGTYQFIAAEEVTPGPIQTTKRKSRFTKAKG